ncbi:MAG: hypothetical protein ACRENF_00480 [Thermodesulfobacteriota bacterium]
MTDSIIRPYEGTDLNSHNFLSTTFPKNYPSLLKQLQEAIKYKAIIEEAAQKFELQSCIIAGLGSRESHWGLALFPPGPEGTGDFVPRIKTKVFRLTPLPPDGLGFGRGLLQIDFDYHEFARTGNWKDPKENIFYGCKLLFDNCTSLLQKHNLNHRQLLRATLSSYNCGLGKVRKTIEKGYDFDFFTTGRNYSQDVLNRAGWFQLQGWS